MADPDYPGPSEASPRARPLRSDDPGLPDHIRSFLHRAQTHWLKNTEVLTILQEYAMHNLVVSTEPPFRPPGGSVFLFDRKVVRFFRKDGHDWRKKGDGKTVRETHEKLKVDNHERLNCYYAHSEREDGPQRRCYWQLEADDRDGKDDIVLVHYLVVDRTRGGGEASAAVAAEAARLGAPVTAPSPALQQETQAHMDLGQLPPLESMDMAAPDGSHAGMDLLLPVSMENFLDTLDHQDMAMQQMRHGHGDDLADHFLPPLDQLAPPGYSNGTWQGQGDRQEIGPHVVQTGRSLRLIEPIDGGGLGSLGSLGSLGQDWASQVGQPLNQGIGNPQVGNDARQTMRRPSFAAATARLSFQDSLLNARQDQMVRDVEAMPGAAAAAALQGVAGPMAGVHPFRGPPAETPYRNANYQLPFHAPQFTYLHGEAAPPGSGFRASDVQPAQNVSPFSSFGQQVSPTGAASSHAKHDIGTRFLETRATAPAAAARGSLLGQRTVSMDPPELRGPTARGVTWRTGNGDIGGSKARGGAYAANKAIGLEAELGVLDREVMQHLRHPGDGQTMDDFDQQVAAFEERLAKMESASSQLQRSRSEALPHLPDDTFGIVAPTDAADNTSTSHASARNEEGTLEAGSPPMPFEILDYTPDWDFCSGGAKLMLAGCLLQEVQVDTHGQELHVMFDRQQVPAEMLRPGVVRVRVPPHDAGPVELKLTFGDGVARSRSVSFTYRALPEPTRGLQDTLIHAPDRELQRRLINMLTGLGSQPASEQDSGGNSSSTSNQMHASTGHASEPPRGQELAGLTWQQGERLLALLLERRVQGLIEALQQGQRDSRELDKLSDSGHAIAHLLAGLGYDRALYSLLGAGADPCVQDAWGHTPLHWAAVRGRGAVAALLVSCKANAESLTYLTEAKRRLTPADAATDSHHHGLAAFLAEVQLVQGVRRMAALKEGSPGLEPSGGTLAMQRKRSRRLPSLDEEGPEMQTGADSPLVSAADARGPGSGADSAIAAAKRNAETLETAILRRAARRAVRDEKRQRARKQQEEALLRLQQRRAHWQQVQQMSATHDGRQHGYLGRYLSVAHRITNLQLSLEGLIAAGVEKTVASPPPPAPPGGGVDYSSDTDIFCRKMSVNSQRKLQHIHNSRRLDGRRSSLPRTQPQDIRSILKAGLGVSHVDTGSLEKRTRSRSTISRALAQVEVLRTDRAARLQYEELRELLRQADVALQEEYGFKFARTAVV